MFRGRIEKQWRNVDGDGNGNAAGGGKSNRQRVATLLLPHNPANFFDRSTEDADMESELVGRIGRVGTSQNSRPTSKLKI